MSLTQNQIEELKNNLSLLDYEENGHIFTDGKRKLVDEYFLFIGVGGTGGRTLRELKEAMEEQIEPDELRKKARFLYVDTDKGNIDYYVCDGGFERKETLALLSNHAVYDSIDPDGNNWPNVKDWCNPRLHSNTSMTNEFGGIGAGGVRQVGRAYLIYADNYRAYTSAVCDAIRDMLGGGAKRIKVYFFAGIAGGTGSGTIIDLALMTRFTCNENFRLNNFRRNNIQLYGNIFLPSACGTYVTAHGDINAFSALKEIDYFMSVRNTGESYTVRYGDDVVVIEDNLFNYCNLVEVDNEEFYFKDPASMARNVTVQSIINTIVDSQYKNPTNDGMFLAATIKSNIDQIKDLLQRKPEGDFPRNANYVYSITRFSQCVIPKDLICSYIMMTVYKNMYQKFLDGAQFLNKPPKYKMQQWENFIAEAQLDEKSIDAIGSSETIKKNVDDAVAHLIRSRGPAYVINMSKDFGEYLRQNYVANAGGLFTSESKKNQRQQKWGKAIEIMNGYSHGLFEIYTLVIEEFSNILNANGEILTDTDKYNNNFGPKSFTWTPICITDKNANNPMAVYINNLLDTNKQAIARLETDFYEVLWSKKDDWASLLDGNSVMKFNAAQDIRDFLKSKVGALVKDSGQDLIVKVYSGDVNATAAGNKDALQKAAQSIYNGCKGRVKPAVSFRRSQYVDCNVLEFMLVPQDWGLLYNELEKNKQPKQGNILYVAVGYDRQDSLYSGK